MKRPWGAVGAIILIAALAGGCATASAIGNAKAQLEKAKAAGAMNKAPFEYYAAEAYLGKAIMEAEEGDNKSADMFTKESAAYSAKALELAGGGAK